MPDFITVARRGEIPAGRARVVEIAGRAIAIFNAGGDFYAIANSCPHRGGPLAEGDVYGARVVCPWHGWEYDLTTGANVDDPTMKLACYRVRLAGDDIMIEIAKAAE